MPRASHVIAALALLATAATAVAQPAGGNRNYVFRSPGSNGAGCLPIDGLEVTVEVTEEIVSNIGMAFQLNATSPPNSYLAFQQYIVGLSASDICVDCAASPYVLHSTTEPWPGPAAHFTSFQNVANHTGSQQPQLLSPRIPKGYRFSWRFDTNGQHQITAVHYRVSDAAQTVLLADDETIADLPAPHTTTPIGKVVLTPMVAFQLDLVGPTNGLVGYLSAGKAKVTYSASTPLVAALGKLPKGCADAGTGTLENSNSTYTAPAASHGGYDQVIGVGQLPPYQPGGAIAAAPDPTGDLDVFAVDANAQLVEFTVGSAGTWSAGTGVVGALLDGGNGLVALPGPQRDHRTFVLGVNQYGGAVAEVLGADRQWTQQGFAPSKGLQRRTTAVAASPRGGVLDFYAVDNQGQVSVSSTGGDGHWTHALAGNTGTLVKASPIAAAPRAGATDQADVFGVDGKGRLVLLTKTGAGGWKQHDPIATGLPASAPLAIGTGPHDRTEVLVVGAHGNLSELHAAPGGEAWSQPTPVEHHADLPPGGHLAALRAGDALDVFAFDTTGKLAMYALGSDGSWTEPVHAASADALPGAALVAIQDHQVAAQIDVLFIDRTGRPTMLRLNGGSWTDATSPSAACEPDYVRDADGTCAHVCTGPNTAMASDGTCACTGGAVVDALGTCTRCPAGSTPNATGGCQPICDGINAVALNDRCGCAPGYTRDGAGVCAACQPGFASVPPSCVAPSDQAAAECAASGGRWQAADGEPQNGDACVYPTSSLDDAR